MTSNRSDAAPKGRSLRRPSKAAGQVTADQVVAYLRDNPDFLSKHPEVIDVLVSPERQSDGRVVDFQQFLVARLRGELASLTASRDALLSAGRVNLSAQGRIHKAALALASARTFEHMVEIVTTDFAAVLDLDVIILGVEQKAANLTNEAHAGVAVLDCGAVAGLLPQSQEIVLRGRTVGDVRLYGPAAGLVTSDALIRLDLGSSAPPALLALGSRRENHFHEGQATELLGFLGRLVARSIKTWLNLPH